MIYVANQEQSLEKIFFSGGDIAALIDVHRDINFSYEHFKFTKLKVE